MLFTVAVDAHDFWVQPDLFQPEPGQEVRVSLRIGENLSGDSLPFVPDWFVDYRVVGPAGPKPIDAIIGDIPAGRFTPSESGIYLIAHQTTADFVDMEAGKFNSYLVKEGLTTALEARAAAGTDSDSGREYYSRYAKALVKAGDDTAEFDGPRQELGYRLEIIPLLDPYELQPDATLPLAVKYEGELLAGITVIAFNSAAPENQQRVVTNKSGKAEIRVDDSKGVWLIKAIHMIAREPDSGADWESFWASLTFRL